jgi:hypothetical protein
MKLRKANKRATTSAFYPDSKIPRKCLNLLDYEAGKIGISGSWCRTSAASAFGARLMPLLNGFKTLGLTQRAMVVQLNDLGIKAPRGGVWSLGQVQRVVQSSAE